ncbi:GMC oxidoreductase [Brachybacterium sp. YJGR34]|uniref:GMC oxidoreductase n=1 Tax=Brachybacterium sp. YJGR34 TaxID=2059911 RepID=UPI000E0C2AC6|nr:GMC family oxidoreductase [Brachybacterium sp. YJGR34]
MQDSDITAAVRAQVARALDPALAREDLIDELTARILAVGTTEQPAWLDAVLAADGEAAGRALRTVVGDALYAHGLAADRVGPALAPHVGAWSPPPPEHWEPLRIGPRDLATPEDLAETYDAIVIGSGAGGGVAAQTLAEAGCSVLVLERGTLPDRSALLTEHLRTPRAASGLFPRSGPGADAEEREVLLGADDLRRVRSADSLWSNNAMTIGGGTRVYGAQAWRLAPRDLAMASTYGVPEGSSLADWPITYDDLEPYYARIEQSFGVSGGSSPGPWDGPRSVPLPMGPFPPSPLSARLERAAGQLGLGTQPVPLLINTRPYAGRSACRRCAQCVGFDCPVGARAGSHTTSLPAALATGNTTLLPGAQASRILVAGSGRARGVELVGARDGRIWRATVRAGLVVLAAGAIESARLLLDSATEEHPHGLGNDTDQVGRHLQGHAYGGASALFAEEVVDLRGPGPQIATTDLRHGNEGIVGGGILADEFVPTPASMQRSLHDTGLVAADTPLGSPTMERAMLRFARIMGPIQEVTSASSRVRRLTGRRDRFGRSLVRLEGSLHPEDLRGRDLLSHRAAAWLAAAGAAEIRPMPSMTAPTPPSGGQHQAGTCRMGTDPARSVVSPEGRVWGHENIVIADGSTHVTNGGVNPVLTILANALRISEGVVSTR